MDIRQLRYFLAIAKEGQITRAAKALNMEQPPLSRQLKMWEQELGTALFERDGKRLRLTPAGELLRKRAEGLIEQLNETITEVKETGAGIQGVLSIGAVVSCISLMPEQIQQFREQYPQVIFKIREGDHSLLDVLLRRRNLELVVARLPFEGSADTQYSVLRLPSDPFVAVIPGSWRTGPGQETLSIRELEHMPFLTLKTDQTTGMHEKVVSECRRHGFEPRIICECSSVAVIISMIAAGIGATLFPESVMASFPIPVIKVLRLEDAELQSDAGIVWLKDRYLSKGAKHFIELFMEKKVDKQ
ncbi:LysR family transcriptional regulator [Paenibacillus filicis]|uniref:LysR family transcriptional regulator n=1 Tax=Paenibacillus gyeongsangnamensis TaxID=3388067 RepID=A0ABT4Q5R2_9BACL|nr:LysR family transcriptional regulator [Paenibacillus filicis]MCZ8512136.1 LysR family transcriptional regulator [Paenibacillus filicis]